MNAQISLENIELKREKDQDITLVNHMKCDSSIWAYITMDDPQVMFHDKREKVPKYSNNYGLLPRCKTTDTFYDSKWGA